jgi:hypothetical protein
MRSSRLAVLLASSCAASLSCATMGEPASEGPPPFTGVKKIALVRVRVDRDRTRQKDVLDALAESLASRGYEVSRMEVGPKPSAELRGVERLYSRIDGLISSAQARPRFGRRAEPAGTDSAEVVRALGVDAVAMYHRFDDRLLLPPPDAPLGGGLFPMRPDQPGLRRPVGALSLVDRSGNATWFAWGGPGGELDPTEPVNAAEAIDMLLRALAGEPEEG